MNSRRGIGLSFCGMSMVLAGCATVRPQADYSRVSERLGTTIGHTEIYRPGEDEQIAGLVEDSLAGGVTVDEAVAIALLNNPSLQAALFDVGIARADVVQAGLFSNPSLGVSLRFPSGGGLANLEAGIAQNIAELWQIPLRQQAAERSLDAVILNVARRAAQLATDTKRAYFTAVQATELHSVVQENLDVATRLSTLAVERKDAGATGQLEVNLAHSAVVQAELQAESTRLAAENALRDLATLLGLSSRASELQLADALPNLPDTKLHDDALVQLALSSRLDVAAGRDLVDGAESRLRAEYRRVFPTIELGVSYEREARKSRPGTSFLRPEEERDTEYVIGPALSLEIPIFDQNQARIAKAEYAYQQAMKTLEAVERQLVQQVHGVLGRVAANGRLVRMYRERSLPLAKENLELSQEAYRLGRASFLSVLEAQRFLLSSRRDYVNALGQAASTLPDLERVVGRPLAEVIEESDSEAEQQVETEQ